DFIRRHKIFRKAARARRILSAPFPTTLANDDMSELEREMQDVPYWKPRKGKMTRPNQCAPANRRPAGQSDRANYGQIQGSSKQPKPAACQSGRRRRKE